MASQLLSPDFFQELEELTLENYKKININFKSLIMTQEFLEILEKLSLNGFELKVETKNDKRYISIVTNLNTTKTKMF